MIIRIASYISILISAASLAWGYSQLGFNSFARWILFFSVIWIFARSQLWWWFSGLGLTVTVLAASFGMLFGIPPGWMLASGIFGLIAWDLTEFHRDTGFKTRNEDLRGMERRHVARLTLLALAGLSLSSIMMFLIRSPFTTEWTLLFGFVAFLGLLQLVLGIRKR